MSLCPWKGLLCNCDRFPYLVNGRVPPPCEKDMPDALLGLRKVSDEGKARHLAYLKEMRA